MLDISIIPLGSSFNWFQLLLRFTLSKESLFFHKDGSVKPRILLLNFNFQRFLPFYMESLSKMLRNSHLINSCFFFNFMILLMFFFLNEISDNMHVLFRSFPQSFISFDFDSTSFC